MSILLIVEHIKTRYSIGHPQIDQDQEHAHVHAQNTISPNTMAFQSTMFAKLFKELRLAHPTFVRVACKKEETEQ